jgi:arginine decarboxylase
MRILKNCVPGDFFVGHGCGESNHGIHAGSFDAAMIECGIEDYNLLAYSSILPKGSKKVDPPKNNIHGEVLHTILACSSTKDSSDKQRLTAGIAIVKVVGEDGEELGGLVAEYSGNAPPEDAEKLLREHLTEMFETRKAIRDKYKNAKISEIKIMGMQSFIPTKAFGTAMVVMGFVNHAREE